MAWSKDDIRIDIYDGEDDVVLAIVETPAGKVNLACNVSTYSDRKLEFKNLHIHSEKVRKNKFGVKNLLNLMRAIAEFYDVDELVVEGAKRTSGANPGKIPRPIRYRQNRRVDTNGRPEL